MNLENAFLVDASAADVWAAILDVERVAGCVPGGQVTGRTDDGGFEATTRIKVGPMTMTYKGIVAIVEQDDQARQAVMSANAREARGQGTATARMTMLVHDERPVRVTIDTDMDVTGRVAQMGRGVMQDVASRIVDQFAENFRALLSAPKFAAPSPASSETVGVNDTQAGDDGSDDNDDLPDEQAAQAGERSRANSVPPATIGRSAALTGGDLTRVLLAGRLRALGSWLRRLTGRHK